MPRSRVARAFAVLLLILAQGAFGLPHSMMGQAAPAHAQASGGMPAGHCQHGSDGGSSHGNAPMPPCGSCPASMPGGQGACPDMSSCGPVSVAASAPGVAMLAPTPTGEVAPAISAPAAHDFIPDPPPPRA